MPGLTTLEDEGLIAAIRRLAFARELDAVADVVRIAARDLTRADGVTFVLRSGNECHYLAENAIAPLWAGRRFPIESCISGWVMSTGTPAVIPDIYQDPRVPHDVYRPTFVKSLAMVPVQREDPVGAIGLYWQSGHTATDVELTRTQALADAAALALTNARLYDELQQALAREHRAREAAEASARLKDEWLSIVSHELRTPLTVIQGRAHMLRDRAPAGDALTRAADAIARNSDHLVRVVDDLLDASKIATGKLRIRREPVKLLALLRDVLEHAGPAASARDITLTFSAEDQVSVQGDPSRLRQVLWNLVTNAIKFSPDKGRVDIVVSTTPAHCVIEVRDMGIGLDPSSIETIFDKFMQVDSSSTRTYAGLGLGLSIAKALVEMHGGTISAASAGLTCGSTFTVRLPR